MKKLVPAVLLLALTTSCASLFTGMTDEIRVTSEPAGAYFRTNLGHFGQTPARIDVPGNKLVEVVYFTQGFVDQEQRLNTRMSHWVWGNVITGFLGALVDVAGPGFTHTQDFIHANLQTKPNAHQHPVAKLPQAPEGTPKRLGLPITPKETAGVEQQHIRSVQKESFEEWQARQGASKDK